MILILTAILVLSPLNWSWGQRAPLPWMPDRKLLMEYLQGDTIDVANCVDDTLAPYSESCYNIHRDKVYWAMMREMIFTTRLYITWLDSVAIQECDNWYSHLSGTGGIRCDTLYWRMTACSLSVVEEGK